MTRDDIETIRERAEKHRLPLRWQTVIEMCDILLGERKLEAEYKFVSSVIIPVEPEPDDV